MFQTKLVFAIRPFAHVISLSEFAGQLTEVNLLAQRAVKGDEGLFQQPLSFGGMIQKTAQFVQSTPVQPAPAPEVEPVAPTNQWRISNKLHKINRN